ncbi:MAG TPA: cytochrome c [Azospirillum sp.]|nr:cytochrome c [Azospirillum sp.]
MTHRTLHAVFAVALSAGLFLASAPAAPAATPEELVKARQQHMKKFGGGMQTIGKFLKGEGGTVEDVQKAAAQIDEAAKGDFTALFQPGTAAPVAESAARPELWQNLPKAQQQWVDVKPQTAKLVAAAATGDKAQIAQAQQATGKACTACHEDFRIKKN